MATDINHDASAGVRTYRGRTIEELIPQIREELGSDAIILREREGVVGGVGGFFAQPFVEVDARRGDAGSIDIYDDMPAADLRLQPAPFTPPVIDRDDGLRAAASAEPRPESAPMPDLDAADAPPVPLPLNTQLPRPFETDLFMQRLREASGVLPDEDDDVLAPPPAMPPAPEPLLGPEPELAASPRPAPAMPAAPEPARELAPEPAAFATPGPETVSAPEFEPAFAPAPAAAAANPPGPKPRTRATPLPDSVRMPAPRPRQRVALTPEPPAQVAPENPYSTVRTGEGLKERGLTRRPVISLPPTPAPIPAMCPAAEPVATRAASAVRRTRQARSTPGLLTTAVSFLGGGGARGRTSSPARRALPSPERAAAQREVSDALTGRGASPEFAADLISAAAVHGSIFDGDVKEAARGELARRMLIAPALPPTGAAIAFIGAGGSGKTSCCAALASAYSRHSTLPVTVLAIDSPDGGQALKRQLCRDNLQVQALSGQRARRASTAGSSGGVVIIDTPATAPTDHDAVAALGASLGGLGLDAIYLTLPATLGPHAARRALAGFSLLAPTAVTITHLDESDQLGLIVDMAISERAPLGYLHSGTDHTNALSFVDPRTVARDLLP